MKSRMWVNCSPHPVVWFVFELVTLRVPPVGFEVDTVWPLRVVLAFDPSNINKSAYRFETVYHTQWNVEIADVFLLQTHEIRE